MSGDGNRLRNESTRVFNLTAETHVFLSHSRIIKIEYHRSYKYWLKWTVPMSIRRSSRLKSTHNSPTRDRYNPKPRLRTRRGRSSLKETDSNESKDCDIIDLINKNPNKSHVPEHKTSTEAVGFLSYGLDESNDESDSESSSIASGPSTLCYDNREELYCHLCSPCHKLYEKAKRLKEPVKNKLLNNDPESLDCDQWVLLKRWTPGRRPNAKRKLLSHVQLDGIDVPRPKHSSPCSRQHTFLRRNLRQSKLLAKRNRKKRRRSSNSQGPRVFKQQRLQNGQDAELKDLGETLNSSFSSCSNLQDFSSPETQSQDRIDETRASAEIQNQERPPKRAEFRKLLAQLQRNSSVIIKETCCQDR
ncbi:PREDICTED: uncharacterized protein LOC107086809 isoform X1 [Cyprinodon variegatus]|uniref:uncharacterized protein LOC107086809 isoform X1 n=2 Tax=Cyprinodon variegatus TaxID=28743 RepID=UPI000742C552|nr:PREDICTED: uncharacterized protein LOC107086809 isoform X1 [Cyprinodon variegatus]